MALVPGQLFPVIRSRRNFVGPPAGQVSLAAMRERSGSEDGFGGDLKNVLELGLGQVM
jgi:hypothetical protein